MCSGVDQPLIELFSVYRSRFFRQPMGVLAGRKLALHQASGEKNIVFISAQLLHPQHLQLLGEDSRVANPVAVQKRLKQPQNSLPLQFQSYSCRLPASVCIPSQAFSQLRPVFQALFRQDPIIGFQFGKNLFQPNPPITSYGPACAETFPCLGQEVKNPIPSRLTA